MIFDLLTAESVVTTDDNSRLTRPDAGVITRPITQNRHQSGLTHQEKP